MGPLGHSVAALVAAGAMPLGLAALALRPRLRVGLAERLGRRGEVRPGSIWIHGASVGEIRAALPLAARLERHGICLSTQTVNGREVARRARPEWPCALAPLDHPWCVAAALSSVRPSALVLVENELWPGWIRAAHARGIPVVAVSARLSARSLRRWRRLRVVSGPLAARLAAVGARTEPDAARFAELGVPAERIQVTGDLKLLPVADPDGLAPDLAAVLAGPLLVAASTHAGEEAAALAAFAGADAAALVLAPRHPERFDAVAELVRGAGLTLRRRSTLGRAPLAPREVLLLDSLGELPGIFARATAAFVGGSLVDRGGHNVVEAVRAGCPVIVGPHLANVEHAVSLLEPSGALLRIDDAAGLGQAWRRALAEPEAAAACARAGAEALAKSGDAVERSARLVEAQL
jgi:3-deoxy-D-manno-octulosonic-acid transferase